MCILDVRSEHSYTNLYTYQKQYQRMHLEGILEFADSNRQLLTFTFNNMINLQIFQLFYFVEHPFRYYVMSFIKQSETASIPFSWRWLILCWNGNSCFDYKLHILFGKFLDAEQNDIKTIWPKPAGKTKKSDNNCRGMKMAKKEIIIHWALIFLHISFFSMLIHKRRYEQDDWNLSVHSINVIINHKRLLF